LLNISGKNLFTCFAVLLPISVFCTLYGLNLSFLKNSLTYNILFLLFISPILEELTFRGLLQDLVQNRTKNYIFTILFINSAFMLLHYKINNSILYLFAVFFCGIIFSVIKIYYKNIIYPIVMHVYYNLCFIIYCKYL
jgi:membrane protease YdiL (CAAX protease family)